MHRNGSILRVLPIALMVGSTLASRLEGQAAVPRRTKEPSLRDTVAVFLTIARKGDVNLHGIPSLVPATRCFQPPATCNRMGYWSANEARGRALLDSVHAMIIAGDSTVTGDAVHLQRMELTAPVFFGSARDSASVEVGVRARLRPGPRGYFESDAHVTLARDPTSRHWSIVKWFTHRIT